MEITNELKQLKKDKKIKAIDDLIEGLEKIKNEIDKYDIHFYIEPNIEEKINWSGKGERYIRYERTIIINDIEPIIEKIERTIW